MVIHFCSDIWRGYTPPAQNTQIHAVTYAPTLLCVDSVEERGGVEERARPTGRPRAGPPRLAAAFVTFEVPLWLEISRISQVSESVILCPVRVYRVRTYAASTSFC